MKGYRALSKGAMVRDKDGQRALYDEVERLESTVIVQKARIEELERQVREARDAEQRKRDAEQRERDAHAEICQRVAEYISQRRYF